ncbi:MAG: outer membrane lipoprotein carrier protein LolA [Treponema sp.]|nr:outer membrane lipoprotein carrier protein LolA [Treponema sp.]
MKRVLSILFFLLAVSVFSAYSQTNSAFSEVCKSISSHKVTKGNFNQTKTIKKINREIKSSGTFIVASENGILWNTKKPYKSSTAITKSGIVQTNAQGKKNVMAAGGNPTFEQVSALMTSLFAGDSDSLGKNFDIEFTGTTENWNANLRPHDSSVRSFMDRIEMAGDSKINTIILQEAGGDFTKYEFSAQNFADFLTDEEKSAFSR